MLQKMKDWFELPSAAFIHESKPPANTPDLCLLQQQQYHWVFDCNDQVQAPVSFAEVYTDQRYHMVIQQHEDRQPGLLFRQDLPKRMTARARVPGKLHIMSPTQMVELDKEKGNRVNSTRKLVRIIIPKFFLDKFDKRLSYGIPARAAAWVYHDEMDPWVEKLQFDFNLFRGRKDSAYLPAPVIKDERPWLDVRFLHRKGEANKPRLSIGYRDGKQYKVDMFHEEKDYQDAQERNPTKPVEWPERKFIVIDSRNGTSIDELDLPEPGKPGKATVS